MGLDGLFGGGGKPEIPAPSKPRPRKIEPDLDRARAKRDIRSRQKSLATSRPLGPAQTKQVKLGA